MNKIEIIQEVKEILPLFNGSYSMNKNSNKGSESMADSNEKSKQEKSSEELAVDRTELAELRSDLAQNRTLQAGERTYAAWIRTGFTIAGAGWTLAQALSRSESNEVALMIGGALIALGILCFIYAWFGFKSVVDFLKDSFREIDDKDIPFTMNLATVSILSVVLVVIFVFAFGMLLF